MVVALLNAYFEVVVPLLEAEGGVIDKYMGGRSVVLFGAPATLPDHATRAVKAAGALVRAVHARRAQWRRLDVRQAWGESGLRVALASTPARRWLAPSVVGGGSTIPSSAIR